MMLPTRTRMWSKGARIEKTMATTFHRWRMTHRIQAIALADYSMKTVHIGMEVVGLGGRLMLVDRPAEGLAICSVK